MNLNRCQLDKAIVSLKIKLGGTNIRLPYRGDPTVKPWEGPVYSRAVQKPF